MNKFKVGMGQLWGNVKTTAEQVSKSDEVKSASSKVMTGMMFGWAKTKENAAKVSEYSQQKWTPM